jgi:DNA-binding XRE family transcriptional regulator
MKYLRTIRSTYGITQQELANAIGVTRPTIGAWESDESYIPSLTNIVKLSKYFDLETEYFDNSKDISDEELKKIVRFKTLSEDPINFDSSLNSKINENMIPKDMIFSEAVNSYVHAVNMISTISTNEDIHNLENLLILNEMLGDQIKHSIDIVKFKNEMLRKEDK